MDIIAVLERFNEQLDQYEAIAFEIYKELQENNVTPAIEEKLSDLRERLYNLSHEFAVQVEPSIQKVLQISPLSFGALDRVIFPTSIFKSPWGPKQPQTKASTDTEATTTTTTTSTNNTSSIATQTKKKRSEADIKPKQKRTKWTNVDHVKYIASIAKRGVKDVEGIANDTNKTKAEVKAHMNSLRLEERRATSKGLRDI